MFFFPLRCLGCCRGCKTELSNFSKVLGTTVESPKTSKCLDYFEFLASNFSTTLLTEMFVPFKVKLDKICFKKDCSKSVLCVVDYFLRNFEKWLNIPKSIFLVFYDLHNFVCLRTYSHYAWPAHGCLIN